MKSLLGWFVAGAMTTLLIAANSGTFRLGDDPELTSAFTYHGQLKSGGDPYSGLADVRLTLWNDAFTGVQVGRTVDFESVTVEDGLFAVEPDFGPDAFNGARRWIEVAVRVPAGSGGYLTLDPRQAVNATPYALYALNGRVGPEGPQGPPGDDQWTTDDSDSAIWTTSPRIGVGAPPAENSVLHLSSTLEGDESVVLPRDSVSSDEILGGLPAVASFSGGGGQNTVWFESDFLIEKSGLVLVIGSGWRYAGSGGTYTNLHIELDGTQLPFWGGGSNSGYGNWGIAYALELEAGNHSITARTGSCQCSNGSAGGSLAILYVGRGIETSP